jgi:DNA-binding winged helix-turn-helix (wHTH) protein
MVLGNEGQSFGDYVFAGVPKTLMRGKEVVNLPHRQLKLLAVLLDAKGEVVSREALMNAVWRDVTVEEHNLTQTVFLLRRSLGRLPSGRDYIETVPRRGYRLSPAVLPIAHPKSDSGPVKPQGSERWKSALQRAAPWLSTVLGFS